MADDSPLRGYGGAQIGHPNVVAAIRSSSPSTSPAPKDLEEERHNPTEHVRFILNLNGGSEESPHSVFTELEELCTDEGQTEWKETARWLRFVEVAEPGGQKWSKPHVSTLSMHSLFQVRDLLRKAAIILDQAGSDMPQIADALLDEMVSLGMLELCLKGVIYTALTQKHMHPPRSRSRRSSVDESAVAEPPLRSPSIVAKQPPKLLMNMPMVPEMWKIMRKIPQGSEICDVLVGEMESISEPIIGFVRLAESIVLQEVTDMPLPVRFLFVLFGPIGSKSLYLDIGRAFATLMSDEVFREVAYKARNHGDMLAGLDEFMDKATVLPPSQWDPTIRVDPPSTIPSQANRLKVTEVPRPSRQLSTVGGGGGGGGGQSNKVQFYKIPFKGIVSDFMGRHRRYYWSDIKDSFNVQVLASIIFVFFANVTPAISFGGLLLTTTEQYLGPVECILSVGIGNFIFSLLGSQPQMLLGSSGATLVFEAIVYTFCKQNNLPFFSFRLWIGFWTMILSVLISIFNLSAIIRIFTRFTEEIYTCLVAFIFAYDSITKLLSLEPTGLDSVQWVTCWDTGLNASTFIKRLSGCTGGVAWTSTSKVANCSVNSTQVMSYVSPDKVLHSFPDCSIGTLEHSTLAVVSSGVYVMSFVIYIGTFFTAYYLKQFRGSLLCTNFIRRHVSSFAILISVIIWVAIDQIVGYPTKKLVVPNVIAGQSLFAAGSGRTTANFIINPMSGGLPSWGVFAAFIPGILLTVLLFMDTQITALVVNRKDNKMKKPGGYHLDFLLVGILAFLHGILGIPFVTGAIVRSIASLQSLQIFSPSAAPGEKLKYLGVIEQRVTGVGLGILASISVLAYPVYQILPLSLLYGVFFFIGVSALSGVQFIDRLFLFITPHKYWPDYKYLRNIRNWRMYFYTAIQLGLLCFLCIFKGVQELNIAFPAMIVLLAISRYFVGYIFSFREMDLMDSVIPIQLFPKWLRKMRSGDVMWGIETTVSKGEEGKEKHKVERAIELEITGKYEEAMRSSEDNDVQVVVTLYETPQLGRHVVGSDDPLQQQGSLSPRSTEV